MMRVLSKRDGITVNRSMWLTLAIVLGIGFHAGRAQTPQFDEAQTRGRPGKLVATRISMVALASQLSRSVGRIVQDRTGLPGVYNITLRATNDGFRRTDPLGRDSADPGAPSIVTALEEQLGLKLESGRGPVDVLIIDRAERPEAN
jgi:uncharacterized protein (TIGR03435 family)